jgi:hypothetical protein
MLKFRFEPQYPISSPAVQFVVDAQRQAPVHPVRATPYNTTGLRQATSSANVHVFAARIFQWTRTRCQRSLNILITGTFADMRFHPR